MGVGQRENNLLVVGGNIVDVFENAQTFFQLVIENKALGFQKLDFYRKGEFFQAVICGTESFEELLLVKIKPDNVFQFFFLEIKVQV